MDGTEQGAGQSFEQIRDQARQAWSEVDPASFTTDEGNADGSSPDATPEPEPVAAPAADEAKAPTTPDATQPESQLADAPDDDEEKIWNQYKDEQARKKALRENKRYAAEMSRKAREAEAELAKLKAERQQQATQPVAPVQTPPPAPAAPPQPAAPAYVPGQPLSPELFQKTLTTLQETDPAVRYAMQGLGQIKQGIESANNEIAELTKAVAEDDKAIQRKMWQIEEYSAAADKQLDEDAKANLQASAAHFRRELIEMKGERSDKVVRARLLTLDLRDLEQKWAIGRDQINQHVDRYLSREAEQAKAEERIQSQTQAADAEWNLGLQGFAKKHNLDADELKDAEDLLLKDVRFELDRLGDEPLDIQGWLNGPAGDRVIATINRWKQRSVKSYADAKRADAAQPAPPGRATDKSGEKPSSKQSLDDALKAARAGIAREFAG